MGDLLDESVANALISSRITGRRQSYIADNPKEGNAVINYLKGGSRPLAVSTAMGRHLLCLEDARRANYAPPGPINNDAEYADGQYSSGKYSQ